MLPFEQETGSFVDPKTGRRFWADVPTIGDTSDATNRFWQVLTRARWATHMFGVVRREVLQQTSLLPNFAGSDRAKLAELALLGHFRRANERLFLKRFHANVSWALDHKELKGFLSTDGKRDLRRLRQIKAFFGAPKRQANWRREQVGVLHAKGVDSLARSQIRIDASLMKAR